MSHNQFINLISCSRLELRTLKQYLEASGVHHVSQEDGRPIWAEVFTSAEVDVGRNLLKCPQPVLAVWLFGKRFQRYETVGFKFADRAFVSFLQFLKAFLVHLMKTDVHVEISDFGMEQGWYYAVAGEVARNHKSVTFSFVLLTDVADIFIEFLVLNSRKS